MIRHRPQEAGASARRHAHRLRRAEIGEQHRTGLPLLVGTLLLDVLVLVPTCADASGPPRLLLLAAIVGAPWWVARRCYRRGGHVERWLRGARGEQRTARLLHPLTRSGWHLLHDRSLSGTTANIDHLAVVPDGRGIVLIDSKQWRRGQTVRVRGGVLHCGTRAYPKVLTTVRWEADRVSALLGRSVAPVIAVHGATVPTGRIRLDGLTIVAAARLRRELAAIPHQPDHEGAALLTDRANRYLPPHTH